MKGMLPVGFPQKTLEPLIDGFSPDVIHLASPFFLGNYAARVAERLQIPTLSIYQTDVAGFARHYGLTIAHDSLKKWVARIHTRTTRTLTPPALTGAITKASWPWLRRYSRTLKTELVTPLIWGRKDSVTMTTRSGVLMDED